MFQIVVPNTPKDTTTCSCCGCYGNDIRMLRVFQSAKISGKMRVVSNNGVAVNLCRNCRGELAHMFEEIDKQ